MKKSHLIMLVLLALLSFPELAQAAAEDVRETTEQSIASLFAIFMDFLNMLLWPFLIIIGDFMDTELILGPGMEERLLSIWVQVRNLVNVCFVLVLLFVALYNVMGFGGGEGELAIKTALPKIALGLILVNFTFVGGKIVLDLTNIATTAMFALPEMAGAEGYNFTATRDEFEQNVCGYYQKATETSPEAWAFWAEPTNAKEEDAIPFQTKLFCSVAEGEAEYHLNDLLDASYFQDLNANNIGLVMAVNMGALSKYSVLKAEGIESFSDLSVSILFSLFMYLVFAISYIVLGIILVVRIVVLWIALALSPVAVLIYVVPQVKEWAGGGGDLQQKIIKTLIAPVIIGATLSLGYIMISAWNDVTGNAGLDYSGFQVDEVLSAEFLASGVDDLPQFIIALASIIIVWVGVFAAASNTYASFATDVIKGFGEKVGGLAAKAPLFLPTITVGTKQDGHPASMSAMQAFTTANNLIDTTGLGGIAPEVIQAIEDKSPTLGKWLRSSAGFRNDEQTLMDLKTSARGAGGEGWTADQLYSHIDSLISKMALKNTPEAREYLTRLKNVNRDNPTLALEQLKEILKTVVEKEHAKETFGVGEDDLKDTEEAVRRVGKIIEPAKEVKKEEEPSSAPPDATTLAAPEEPSAVTSAATPPAVPAAATPAETPPAVPAAATPAVPPAAAPVATPP